MINAAYGLIGGYAFILFGYPRTTGKKILESIQIPITMIIYSKPFINLAYLGKIKIE
jgi:hypothetical protein